MKDQIIVIDRKGKEHVLEAEEGLVLMEIIRDAGLPIEAACGGCTACATCHVYIDKDWLKKLKTREDKTFIKKCIGRFNSWWVWKKRK